MKDREGSIEGIPPAVIESNNDGFIRHRFFVFDMGDELL